MRLDDMLLTELRAEPGTFPQRAADRGATSNGYPTLCRSLGGEKS